MIAAIQNPSFRFSAIVLTMSLALFAVMAPLLVHHAENQVVSNTEIVVIITDADRDDDSPVVSPLVLSAGDHLIEGSVEHEEFLAVVHQPLRLLEVSDFQDPELCPRGTNDPICYDMDTDGRPVTSVVYSTEEGRLEPELRMEQEAMMLEYTGN